MTHKPNLRFEISCAVILAAIVGCKEPRLEEPSPPPGAGSTQLANYEKGRWRLSTFHDLDRVVLWMSHILIRHDASASTALNVFRPIGWAPDGPLPERSRARARELAVRLADQINRDPSRFEAVAREHSEDLASRDQGGRLGGIKASQLAPAFLDAWQAIGWHKTSGVIETEYGFHILKKLPPPPEQKLAGQRVVIRYRGTILNPVLAEPTRSRDEALRLARTVAASREPFSQLVQSHSETEDRIREGDMGVRSARSAVESAGAFDALGRLAVGEVSRPIDSPEGIAVIKRNPPEERATLSATLIRLTYDPTVVGDREAQAGTARDLAARARTDPGAFDRAQREGCCDEIVQWSLGTGHPALEAAVARLSVGAIAGEPVDLGWVYVIPKRLEPTDRRPERLSYELPAPRGIDVKAYVEASDGAVLAASMRDMRIERARALPLPEADAARLDQMLTDLEAAFARAGSSAERLDAYAQASERLNTQLPAETVRRFLEFSRVWLNNAVMNLPR